MKICFILPNNTSVPIGGYKIVYEYANRLVNHGHNVSILYINSLRLKRYPVPLGIRRLLFDVIDRIEPKWFSLVSQVDKISDLSGNWKQKTQDVDVVIGTSISTIQYVLDGFEHSKKGYLIQGYETWSACPEILHKSYSEGLKNIVVSKWLKGIVDQYSLAPSVLISNPIDENVYYEKIPYADRYPHSIGALYNPNECKGFKYALSAIKKIKRLYPDLKVSIFGAYEKPKNLPPWIRYTYKANENEVVKIYNSVRVFVCASVEDGFGLTGCEAMSCGCVLVSTDYGGVHEYANSENALLSPPCDVDAMVKNIVRIFEDMEHGMNLAKYLLSNRQKCNNWDDATARLLEAAE